MCNPPEQSAKTGEIQRSCSASHLYCNSATRHWSWARSSTADSEEAIREPEFDVSFVLLASELVIVPDSSQSYFHAESSVTARNVIDLTCGTVLLCRKVAIISSYFKILDDGSGMLEAKAIIALTLCIFLIGRKFEVDSAIFKSFLFPSGTVSNSADFRDTVMPSVRPILADNPTQCERRLELRAAVNRMDVYVRCGV
jgi:hypothetical protein